MKKMFKIISVIVPCLLFPVTVLAAGSDSGEGSSMPEKIIAVFLVLAGVIFLLMRRKKNNPNNSGDGKAAKPDDEPEFEMDEDTGRIETSVIGGAYDTVPLDEENGTTALDNTTPFLFRLKSRDKIFIVSNDFRIGRDPAQADCLISDNPAVGRFHAVITFEKGDAFLIDMDSINGTYVNGNPIPSNQRVQIYRGDKITFANEDFIFDSEN